MAPRTEKALAKLRALIALIDAREEAIKDAERAGDYANHCLDDLSFMRRGYSEVGPIAGKAVQQILAESKRAAKLIAAHQLDDALCELAAAIDAVRRELTLCASNAEQALAAVSLEIKTRNKSDGL